MFVETVINPNQSATRRAYLRLRRDIINGKLPPGERLKIETLKSDLDTGASPLREALSLLTSDHLVERLDQRGFWVAPVSRIQFDEVLKLRCTLEVLALRESLAIGDQGWEEDLVLAHHRLSKANRDSLEVFETLHKKFHMALISACKSPILLKFCGQLYDLNVRYRHLAGTSKGYARRNISGEHAAILEAAVDRNFDVASERLLAHYQKTGAFLAELID